MADFEETLEGITDEQDVDETNDERSLIIAGEQDVEVLAPVNMPPQHLLSDNEQKELADRIINEVDDHDEGLPFLPLNLEKLCIWSIEDVFLPAEPGEKLDSNPGIIITFASPDDPRGTPYLLKRDRALKFASQIKRHANTGPSIQRRAAASGLSVPEDAPSSGGLILPGH